MAVGTEWRAAIPLPASLRRNNKSEHLRLHHTSVINTKHTGRYFQDPGWIILRSPTVHLFVGTMTRGSELFNRLT